MAQGPATAPAGDVTPIDEYASKSKTVFREVWRRIHQEDAVIAGKPEDRKELGTLIRPDAGKGPTAPVTAVPAAPTVPKIETPKVAVAPPSIPTVPAAPSVPKVETPKVTVARVAATSRRRRQRLPLLALRFQRRPPSRPT